MLSILNWWHSVSKSNRITNSLSAFHSVREDSGFIFVFTKAFLDPLSVGDGMRVEGRAPRKAIVRMELFIKFIDWAEVEDYGSCASELGHIIFRFLLQLASVLQWRKHNASFLVIWRKWQQLRLSRVSICLHARSYGRRIGCRLAQSAALVHSRFFSTFLTG